MHAWRRSRRTHGCLILYKDQGDLHQAQELFEEARRKGYVEAAFGLGALYNDQGEAAQAQDLFEEARRKGVDKKFFGKTSPVQQSCMAGFVRSGLEQKSCTAGFARGGLAKKELHSTTEGD